jgi:thimet oligopeptidase
MRLFGLEFHRVDIPVWHPSVEAYEVFEEGRLVGRFYLDMHPREGKFTHAAAFGIRSGALGRRLPEAALICNFPELTAEDAGLMEHGEVLTFLHEFGHLVHFIVSGQRPWVGTGGFNVEGDFVDAPSQMLEEWGWDPAVLATFARHYRTGEAVPPGLVQQLRRSEEAGKGLSIREQMAFARISLTLHDRPPAQVDTDSIAVGAVHELTPVRLPPDTHFQAAFGHLADDAYAATYYVYLWAGVISKDLFSRFDRSNLLDPAIAREYREKILEPGSSKPANRLIEDFLGRPFSVEAWQRWLDEESMARVD